MKCLKPPVSKELDYKKVRDRFRERLRKKIGLHCRDIFK
jgi:hypothetical protein